MHEQAQTRRVYRVSEYRVVNDGPSHFTSPRISIYLHVQRVKLPTTTYYMYYYYVRIRSSSIREITGVHDEEPR
jgi:hypothetical protein